MQYRLLQQRLKEMRTSYGLAVIDVPLNATKEKLAACYLKVVNGEVIKYDSREQSRLAEFNQVKEKGLNDQNKVIAFIQAQGWDVLPSTQKEDMVFDIDCWVKFPGCQNHVSVSIKAEHKGLEYNNVYWQLEEQLTCNGSWVASGLYTTKAKVYAILQGSTLRFYITSEVKDYVAKHGWLKVLPLSAKSKAYLGGGYRYKDARSGYLNPDSVRNVKFEMGLTTNES